MNRLTVSALSLSAALGLGSASAKDLPAVKYTKFASGFVSPVAMIPYQKGDQAFLVVDQAGVIHFLSEDGGSPGKAFLDLKKHITKLKPGFDERGSLGIALHPKFASNKKCYVYYSAPLAKDGAEGFDHTARVSEFKVEADGTADVKSERILLTVDQPQFNHDGGHMVFGSDGYLYIGLGDGGAANDLGKGHEKGGNGQATNRLLGSILRIDVDNGKPYGIPADNPFAKNKKGRPEIYAWGIRNPWGITADGDNVIIADVGQGRFEEINVIGKGGGNYGWPTYEGYAKFNQKNPSEIVKAKPAPAPTGFKAPVLVYPHASVYGEAPGYGISVTGGHVYRGKALPGLTGVYLFGDWTQSWAGKKHGLYAGIPGDGPTWAMQILPGAKAPEGPSQNIIGFGLDHDGEIYVLTNEGKGPKGTKGAVFKIEPK